jgi:hypothetical protein
MNWTAVVVVLAMQVLPPSAPRWSAALQVAAPASLRGCIDKAGQDADCGSDPTVWHECYAADQFGRCPPDPSCYDRDGIQVRCELPVTRKVVECPAGTPIGTRADRKIACADPLGVPRVRP